MRCVFLVLLLYAQYLAVTSYLQVQIHLAPGITPRLEQDGNSRRSDGIIPRPVAPHNSVTHGVSSTVVHFVQSYWQLPLLDTTHNMQHIRQQGHINQGPVVIFEEMQVSSCCMSEQNLLQRKQRPGPMHLRVS